MSHDIHLAISHIANDAAAAYDGHVVMLDH